MALLVPVALAAILLVLALHYRSRDGGLKACLLRVEQLLAGALECCDPITLREQDQDILREAPEHLFRLVASAMAGGDREAIAKALAAIREYRAFRGWPDGAA
ncbi:hypothetical protein [Maricaulis maris]|jgi:hypothetical protein|uniref:hypothetical protein n=1 Tax=Maricaulis maris TaxID=74318 RepID=UPI002924679E|nr:hypothetical protein MACH15_23390 [Maricaulis maris]